MQGFSYLALLTRPSHRGERRAARFGVSKIKACREPDDAPRCFPYLACYVACYVAFRSVARRARVFDARAAPTFAIERGAT